MVAGCRCSVAKADQPGDARFPGWDTYIERRGYGLEAAVKFADVRVDEYAAVLVLGSRAPEYLVRSAAAGLARGKRVTYYEHVRVEAEQAGAIFVNEQTVREGQILTAQTWQSHPSFYREIFTQLSEKRVPLDPEVAALLERQKHLPPRSTLDVAATRDMMRRAGTFAGEAPPLPKVEDILLPGGLGPRQYWPTMDDGMPMVGYFHGCRFFGGDLESHDTICRPLAAARCRVIAVDYRHAPEHRFPAAAEDACRAIEWAVGVTGDSTGANLAAVAALVQRDSGLRCRLGGVPSRRCRSARPASLSALH